MRGRAIATAIAWVDPRIHRLAFKWMDCRVKPGNDETETRRNKRNAALADFSSNADRHPVLDEGCIHDATSSKLSLPACRIIVIGKVLGRGTRPCRTDETTQGKPTWHGSRPPISRMDG
jgi:hypothetical protein